MVMKMYTSSQIKKLKDRTDWARVKKMRDSDIDFTDIPMAMPDMLSNAVPYRRGRPVKENKKVLTNLRLDPEVVSFFQNKGPRWQTRINDTLLQVVRLSSLL